MLNTPVSTPEELGLEEGWLHFSQLLETDRRWAPPLVDIKWDDPAVIQYTGGTTGIPKGAVLTQYNIIAGTMSCVLWSQACVDHVPLEKMSVLSVLPFSHVYGEICCLCWAAWCVGTMIILPRFDVDEMFDVLNKFDTITYWPCVPTMVQALFYHPGFTKLTGTKKSFIPEPVAPAPLELIRKCRELDFPSMKDTE